jgi:chondroitin 4-sulfotransferase 11
MLVSHKYKIIFIHIPKNAGTFIWNILKKIDPELKEYWKHTTRQTLHHTMKESYALLDFNYSDYDIICVVRNPYHSLVSFYNYIKNREGYPTHNIVKNLSFKDFIMYKFNEIDFLHTNYNCQYDFIYDENEKTIINNIIRYENLILDLKNLFEKKKIDINDSLLNDYINKGDINQHEYLYYYKDIKLKFIVNNIPNFKKDLEYFNYS